MLDDQPPSRDEAHGSAGSPGRECRARRALVEIVGVLYEGRMDGGNATMCRSPRAHEEVSTNITTFARGAETRQESEGPVPGRIGAFICALLLTVGHLVTGFVSVTAHIASPAGPWDTESVAHSGWPTDGIR